MNRTLLTLVAMLCLFHNGQAQKTPKRELRGAWITTHLSLDWPNRNQTPTQQQSALLSILEQHKATGMNTMYFQVRSQSDAMYPSTIEPWAAVLGGPQGTDPGWDPLQYALTETRRRGMEFHAWINPYRAVANVDSLPKFAPNHVAKQHPEWLIANAKERILNPGLPEVRAYLLSVIVDIVNRYDIDGIHFDDYFYPNIAFNDDAAYNADPRGFPATTVGRADWRRANVNLLIKSISDTIQVLKPWVKFGVSPSGIYRNSTNPALGSNTSGLQHYSALYADTKKWLQEGWIDYLAPQVYWYIGQPGSDYGVLIPWWNNNAFGRHIYIGQAIYKVNDPLQGTNWANRSQIPNQMRLNREAAYPNIYGEIAFRTAFLRSNPLSVRDSIRLRIYKKPVLPPTMEWKDHIAPDAPTHLTAAKQNNSYVLNWTKPSTTDEMNKARQFVIYRSLTPTIDISDTANLVAITNTDVTTYTDTGIPTTTKYYYTVTAVDRLYNESLPSNVTDYEPPTIRGPEQQHLSLNTSCAAALPDYTRLAAVSDDVTPANAIVITQSPTAGSMINDSGTTIVTLTATDASGKKATWDFNLITKDDTAPIISSCALDKNVGTDAGVCFATVTVGFPAVTDNCGVTSLIGTRSDNQSLTASFPKGTTTINWVAKDAAGNIATCTQTITVSDTEAPVISNLTADPSVLKAPNHKMRDVTISYTLSDNCSPVKSTITINSNEPANGPGDGTTEPDWEIVDEHHVKLRAERSGTGIGRMYTITITAKDEAGNIKTESVNVLVPHDNGKAVETLVIKAASNPSPDQFVIQTESTSNELLTLKVTDSYGKVMETRRSVVPNTVLYIGQGYRPGVYYIEVSQGKEKQSLKLIKQ